MARTRYISSLEVHALELPNMTKKRSLEFWIDEMSNFKDYLEKCLGVKNTDEKLKETIEIFNKERDAPSAICKWFYIW